MGVYDSVPSANVPATLRSSLRYGERQEERPESALADRALAQQVQPVYPMNLHWEVRRG